MTDLTTLVFGAIIIVLLGGFGWYVREQSRERSKLINAILAKDSNEYVNRTLAENTEIKPEVNGQQDPDLIPFDQLNDEQFDNHIQSSLGNEVAEQEVV